MRMKTICMFQEWRLYMLRLQWNAFAKAAWIFYRNFLDMENVKTFKFLLLYRYSSNASFKTSNSKVNYYGNCLESLYNSSSKLHNRIKSFLIKIYNPRQPRLIMQTRTMLHSIYERNERTITLHVYTALSRSQIINQTIHLFQTVSFHPHLSFHPSNWRSTFSLKESLLPKFFLLEHFPRYFRNTSDAFINHTRELYRVRTPLRHVAALFSAFPNAFASKEFAACHRQLASLVMEWFERF